MLELANKSVCVTTWNAVILKTTTGGGLFHGISDIPVLQRTVYLASAPRTRRGCGRTNNLVYKVAELNKNMKTVAY